MMIVNHTVVALKGGPYDGGNQFVESIELADMIFFDLQNDKYALYLYKGRCGTADTSLGSLPCREYEFGGIIMADQLERA